MAGAKKRKFQWAISLFLVLYFYGMPAQAQYGGGSGTAEDPYLIYTAEQLNEIGLHEDDWDKHFKLMADIDLSSYTGTDFNIIGIDWANPFTGVFDGNGHTISNFGYVSVEGVHIGLFGNVGYAHRRGNPQIKDLGMIDPNVDAVTGKYVGSLVGHLRDGNITGCYAEGGRVSGNGSVGGLSGKIWWGTITNCHSTSSVTGERDVGGLVGGNYGGTLANCYSTGSVTGERDVGGLVGSNSHFGEIVNCYAAGDITGNEDVGGLVGWNGHRNNRPGIIRSCYSVGRVTGSSYVGGLVGWNWWNWGAAEFSFWDIETSNQITSAGGTGKTTDEMQTASTFLNAGWDFVEETENGTDDIWWILEGQDYPRLWWELFWAVSPYPQDGSTDVTQPLILRWAPGVSALYHDVYFGEDKDAVKNATTDSPEYKGSRDLGSESYDPGKLALDTTYYWRIDEVNEADPDSPWKGIVWSFTTGDFFIVDDFESYNDLDPPDRYSNRIFLTWIDGWDDPANGSIVDSADKSGWPWVWSIAHSGFESMWYSYDNNVGISEVTANIDNLAIGRDWTIEDVGVLSLWLYGYMTNDPELIYVALANNNGTTGVSYHDNPNAALLEEWLEWRIVLQDFVDQGVNLTNVKSITLGFGNRNNPVAGGRGEMWFDDIRLYRPTAEPAP